MITVYIYVLDTLADWEIGYITAELHSKRFFKKDAQDVLIQTVSISKEPIQTMGGLTVVPDCLINDITIDKNTVLLLPGATTWNDPQNATIINKANDLLAVGGTVGAICGATGALANFGLLDKRLHTSNGKEFLEMVSPNYKGQDFYIEALSVSDNNLITASSCGSLLWAKQIFEHVDVFQSDTLESWYEYFNTGDPTHFFDLMKTLPNNN